VADQGEAGRSQGAEGPIPPAAQALRRKETVSLRVNRRLPTHRSDPEPYAPVEYPRRLRASLLVWGRRTREPRNASEQSHPMTGIRPSPPVSLIALVPLVA